MLKIGKHAWKSLSWWTFGSAAGWQMNVEFGCRIVPSCYFVGNNVYVVDHRCLLCLATDVCCRSTVCVVMVNNWMAPWKNLINSTTMILRKSLVKPVTQQNISSCLVLSPEIVMHDAFNVILWTYADNCVVVHLEKLNNSILIAGFLLRHWLYEWFSSAENVRRYMSCMTISAGRTEQHIVIGFGELAAVD